MKKLSLFSIVFAALLFAGCLNQLQAGASSSTGGGNNSAGVAQGTQISEVGLIGDIQNFALTANDAEGFEVSSYSDLSPGENGTELASAGFEQGYSVGLAKYDAQNFERIVHQVTRYNTREGAMKAFGETRKVILEGKEVVSELNLPRLGEKQFGAKGSRTINLGVKSATIDDYIVVFVKSNVLVAVEYFGLAESTNEAKALGFAQIAAGKFAG